ncbi:hypothetical protein [Dactylococcopsis salina]|nr:hypothetical protein [Dactylococcopsis salina]
MVSGEENSLLDRAIESKLNQFNKQNFDRASYKHLSDMTELAD